MKQILQELRNLLLLQIENEPETIFFMLGFFIGYILAYLTL